MLQNFRFDSYEKQLFFFFLQTGAVLRMMTPIAERLESLSQNTYASYRSFIYDCIFSSFFVCKFNLERICV